jgi:hypothetical protein
MNIVIIGTENLVGTLVQGIIKALRNVLMGAGFPLSKKSLKLEAIIGANRFTAAENAIKQLEVICF